MKTTQNILRSSLIFWALLAGAVGCTNTDIAVSKSGKLTTSDENGYLFSQLPVGNVEEKCIRLSNRDDAPGEVTITKLEIAEATGRREFRISKVGDKAFKGKTFEKLSLQPGEATDVCVEYIPTDSARDAAELIVSVEGDSSLEDGKYTVNISSESTAPILGIPLSVKFPGVLSTEWQCRTQAVSNLGLEKLQIKSVSLDDRNRYFHVRFFENKPVEDCPAGPTRFSGKSVDDILQTYGKGGEETLTNKVLQSRGSEGSVMWVRYFFMPSAVNKAEASLIFQTNQVHDDGKVTVSLSGNASDVCIESIPSKVDFDEATTTYPQKRQVKITNCSLEENKVVKINRIFLDQVDDFSIDRESTSTTSQEVKSLLDEMDADPSKTPAPIELKSKKSILVDLTFKPKVEPKNSNGEYIEGALVLNLEGSETASVKIPLVGKNVFELKPIARLQAKVELAESIKKRELTKNNISSQSVVMRNIDEIAFDTSGSFIPKGYTISSVKWNVSYAPSDKAAVDAAIKGIHPSRFSGNSVQITPEDWKNLPGNHRLQLTVAGSYTFTYQICVKRDKDPSAAEVCSDENDFRSRVTAEVRSDKAILVQLTWYSTRGTEVPAPGFTGADLDLYLAYGGSKDAAWQGDMTSYHKNKRVQVGIKTVMSFERDDRNGDGPESISVASPSVSDKFYIGVAQYDDNKYADSWATITVYIEGRKYWSTVFSPPPRKFASIPGSSETNKKTPFWVVAAIKWSKSSGVASPQITVIDDYVSSVAEANKVLSRYTRR